MSEPYVDRGIARSMLATALATRSGEAPADRLFLVIGMGALEGWLRDSFLRQ
jgi:hypothetical protein